MRLLYFSSGPRERILEALLGAGHDVTGIYVTDPDRWPKVGPTVQIARKYDLPVRIIQKSELRELGPEVRGATCLSAGFAYLFPQEFLSQAALCLNVHGTLLPKYAGARTLNWVIENGDSESGVTVHKIDAGMDTGPILLQVTFPISRFDTTDSLFAKTLTLEPKVVLKALDLVEKDTAHFRAQSPESADRFPDRTPGDSEVDPKLPLNQLYNKIRACPPDRFPAHFWIDGEKVCIRLWRPDKSDDEPFSDLMI